VRETGVTGIYGSLGIGVTETAVEFELAPTPALRRPLVISEVSIVPYYTLSVGTAGSPSSYWAWVAMASLNLTDPRTRNPGGVRLVLAPGAGGRAGGVLGE
jgi:hypothetical protein